MGIISFSKNGNMDYVVIYGQISKKERTKMIERKFENKITLSFTVVYSFTIDRINGDPKADYSDIHKETVRCVITSSRGNAYEYALIKSMSNMERIIVYGRMKKDQFGQPSVIADSVIAPERLAMICYDNGDTDNQKFSPNKMKKKNEEGFGEKKEESPPPKDKYDFD